MSENRRYRKFSAQQKTELVLASLRGGKTISELCREHDISDSLAQEVARAIPRGRRRAAVGQGRADRDDELRRQVSRLERALGRKTMEVEIAGELLRGWE